MYYKEKQLAQSYIAGKVSRRSMLRGMASMGVTAAAAGVLVNAAATQALAQNGFDWQKHA